MESLLNILTIDLEEWYHPEYVRSIALRNKKERGVQSLRKTLRLLDEHDVDATFFVVGEVLEKYPEIVEEIEEKGHEIAFHGYHHESLSESNPKTLLQEIRRFNSLMEKKCLGFRAPSFSLNNETKWALKILEEAGYIYDSSIFPLKTPLYGVSGAPIKPYKLSFEDVTKETENGKLWEFPLLVYDVFSFRIPLAGGFYLRVFPTGMIKRAVRKMNSWEAPAVIYVHTWELDSKTPILRLGLYKSYVTYHNIGKTEKKLKHLLSCFRFTSFRNYIETRALT